LDLFVEEWTVRAEPALSTGLVEELGGMVDRHPWYFNPAPASQNPNINSHGWSGSVEEWRGLVAAYFPPEAVETALCLMGPESGGDPNAHSGSDSIGLMQIHAPTWADFYGVSWSDLLNPAINMRIAADIFLNQGGWIHWNPWRRGECQ
jgi:hypothetical protein